MAVVPVYEQTIKQLSPEDKLAIARLTMTDVVPEPAPSASYKPAEDEESGFEYLKRLLPNIECIPLTQRDLDSVILR